MSQKNIKYILFFNFAAILKNLQGIIRAKIVSLWLGVQGVGILGQIVMLYGLQTKIIDLGVYPLLNNRIGKIEIANDSKEYIQLWIYSFYVLLLSNAIFFLFMYFGAKDISILLFKSAKYQHLIILLAFINPIFSYAYFTEILIQALKEFRLLAIGQNISGAIGVLTAVPTIWFWGIEGIIYNLYIFLIANLVFFSIVSRPYLPVFSLEYIKIQKNKLIELTKFCLTNTFRKILAVFSLLIFRVFIVQFLGLESNGFFQSAFSISNYLNIIYSAFIVYLFPTLSGYTESTEFNKSLNENFRYLLYIIFPFAAVIMAFSDVFLILFYSEAFISMKYELSVLTFLKVFESIHAFYTIAFLAATRLKLFILLEFSRSLSLVGISYWAINYYGLDGAVWSMAAMNIASFLMLIFLLNRHGMFALNTSNRLLVVKILGLCSIFLIPNWTTITFRIIAIAAFLVLTAASIDIKLYANLAKMYLPIKKKNDEG